MLYYIAKELNRGRRSRTYPINILRLIDHVLNYIRIWKGERILHYLIGAILLNQIWVQEAIVEIVKCIFSWLSKVVWE